MESKKIGKAIMYGIVTILVFGILSSLGFALILRYTNTSETTVGYLILITSFLSLFIGGFVSGAKGKRSGWALGSVTGVAYITAIFLFQYLGLDLSISLKQGAYDLAFVLVAVMGGILGVNMTSKRQ